MITTNLKNLLDNKKISINKLSNETGLSRPTLTSLMNNESKGIQFDTLERLLDYFEISLSDFFNVYHEEITFSFYSTVPLSKTKEIENAPFSKTETNTKFVEVNPSQMIPYICKITIDEKIGELFSATIVPILDNNKVVAIGLLFYRADESGEEQSISDVKAFINKLNGDVLADLVKHFLDSWYSRYKLVKKASFSEMFIVNLTFLDKKQTSLPILVTTYQKYNKDIVFHLDAFKEGDSDFSDYVIIQETDQPFWCTK